jgi:hypothetical protein
MSTTRVRRVEAPREVEAGDALAEPDYASAFELPTPDAGRLTPEQWARATWEGAPGLLRRFVLTGWTLVLGLRLGPRPSPTHVLGWLISAADSNSITLQADSRLLAAQNIVVVDGSSVVWVTLVRFDRRIARPMWAIATPIHHMTIRYLLAHAGLSSHSQG